MRLHLIAITAIIGSQTLFSNLAEASCASDLKQKAEVTRNEILDCIDQMQKGEKGDQGLKGDQGPPGAKGESGGGIPSGAVVAFVDACPKDGWSPYKPATSRILIGGGDQFDAAYENWEQQFPTAAKVIHLSKYTVGARGGEESHILTADEMPPHYHDVYDYSGVRSEDSGYKDLVRGSVKSETAPFVKRGVTGSYGGGGAHNNLPPYIAVYFCRKD